MTCLTCKYSDSVENGREKQRICRRNPPHVVLVPTRTLQGDALALQAVFAPVKDADFCGEFSEVKLDD